MRIFVLVAILLGALTFSAVGQTFVQNTMHPFSRFLYNPAAAGTKMPGTDYRSTLTLLGRQQWLGLDGAPRLISAMYSTPLQGISSAVGASIIRDEQGPLSTTGLNVAYAYQLKFGDESGAARLSFGINGGFLQKSLNGEFIYDNRAGDDPVVPLGTFSSSTVVPSLGAGIFYTGTDDKFFVGLSGQDLLEPEIEDLLLTSGIGPASKVARSFYLMGGYTFDLQNDMSLQPVVMLKTDGVGEPQYDVSLYWRYKPMVFGVSNRFNTNSYESVSGILGFNVLDRAFVGYSFDFTVNALSRGRDVNSHEIIVSWAFPGGSSNPGQLQDIDSEGLKDPIN
ncbi:MAG: type IX secretion system membrane protein PorP/SprF [Bacteroidota bacterium]